MQFYNHQASYNTIDMIEIKRLLNLIANSKGLKDVYCTGWSTTLIYELTNKKSYDLTRSATIWDEEFINIEYKTLDAEDLKQRVQVLEDPSSNMLFTCIADKLFKKYKVKLGFYKRHAYNDEEY